MPPPPVVRQGFAAVLRIQFGILAGAIKAIKLNTVALLMLTSLWQFLVIALLSWGPHLGGVWGRDMVLV